MPPVPPGYFLAAKKRMRMGMHPALVQARERFNSPDPAAPMVQRQPVAPRPDQVRGAWAQQPPPQPRSTAPDWGNVRYNNVAGNPRQGMDYREKMLPDGNVLHDYPGTANDVVVRPHTRRLPVTGGVQAPGYGGLSAKKDSQLQMALAALLINQQKSKRRF
jgi:hypothetical protein